MTLSLYPPNNFNFEGFGRAALERYQQRLVERVPQALNQVMPNGRRMYSPNRPGSSLARSVRQKTGRSYTRTRTRRKSSLGSSLSFQNDMALRYQRRAMPKRKRRVWKRFSRRVKHVMLQMQPLRFYTSDNLGAETQISVNTQAIFGCTLLGTNITNNNEVLQIFKDAFSTVSAATSTSYSLFLKSACLDVQLTNTGSDPIYLDVYYVKPRRGKPWESADQIGSVFTNSYGEMQTITANSATNPAVTAFQNPVFCSYFRILRKVEHLLAPSQTRSIQVRSPANTYIQGKRLINEPQMLKEGTALLFMARGAPESDGAGGSQLSAGFINWRTQVTLVYGVPPSSTTRSGGHTD